MRANSHSFNVDLATKVGLIPALLLQHFYFWHQRSRDESNIDAEGHVWFFMSRKQITSIFPYLTESMIRTATKNLEELGYILEGEPESGSFNRAKWYCLTELGLQAFEEIANAFEKSTETSLKSSPQDIRTMVIKTHTNRGGSPKRFSPPTLEQVQQFVKERNLIADPERFILYYESKGWKVGNSPMKSWTSALLGWDKRDREDKEKNSAKRESTTKSKSVTQHNIDVLNRFTENLAKQYPGFSGDSVFGADEQ